MKTDLRAGDRVFYVLPKSKAAHRFADRYLPAQVVNVTRKRVVIRVDGETAHRCVLPPSLVRALPGGNTL